MSVTPKEPVQSIPLNAMEPTDGRWPPYCYLDAEVNKPVAATVARTVSSKTPLAMIHVAGRHRRGRAASGLAQNPQASDHCGLRPPQPGHMLCSAAVGL